MPTSSFSSPGPPYSTQPPALDTGSSSSSALPYSLLIAFLVVFLFFLGCAIGSRRLARHIRRTVGRPADSLPQHEHKHHLVCPVLFDVYPQRVYSDETKWQGMLPLAAMHLREPPRSPAPAPPPQTAPAPRFALLSRVPQFLPLFSVLFAIREVRAEAVASPPPAVRDPDAGNIIRAVHALHVAVLVAMPSPVRRADPLGRGGGEEMRGDSNGAHAGEMRVEASTPDSVPPREFAIGIARVCSEADGGL